MTTLAATTGTVIVIVVVAAVLLFGAGILGAWLNERAGKAAAAADVAGAKETMRQVKADAAAPVDEMDADELLRDIQRGNR